MFWTTFETNQLNLFPFELTEFTRNIVSFNNDMKK